MIKKIIFAVSWLTLTTCPIPGPLLTNTGALPGILRTARGTISIVETVAVVVLLASVHGYASGLTAGLRPIAIAHLARLKRTATASTARPGISRPDHGKITSFRVWLILFIKWCENRFLVSWVTFGCYLYCITKTLWKNVIPLTIFRSFGNSFTIQPIQAQNCIGVRLTNWNAWRKFGKA